MRISSQRVLVIFDVPYSWDDTLTASQALVGEEWEDERDVVQALQDLNFEVDIIGLFDEVKPLLKRVESFKPDCIFNLSESFKTNRDHEPHIAALFELLGIPYTGARPDALNLCKDKGLSKMVLKFHGIRVPNFHVYKPHEIDRTTLQMFSYPGVCKPTVLDSSEGISQNSLVKNPEEALKRLEHLHLRYNTSAILEEYIPGKEIYVGLLGVDDEVRVLPPRELRFGNLPKTAPKLLTYKAKWDMSYRKKYGIDSGPAEGLPPPILQNIEDYCKKIYQVLKLSGYARIDLRLDAAGDPVFIEANPNPSIKKSDDFAEAACHAGMSYADLIGEIVALAMGRANLQAASRAA